MREVRADRERSHAERYRPGPTHPVSRAASTGIAGADSRARGVQRGPLFQRRNPDTSTVAWPSATGSRADWFPGLASPGRRASSATQPARGGSIPAAKDGMHRTVRCHVAQRRMPGRSRRVAPEWLRRQSPVAADRPDSCVCGFATAPAESAYRRRQSASGAWPERGRCSSLPAPLRRACRPPGHVPYTRPLPRIRDTRREQSHKRA
ncbi:hypothetical protein R75465_08629 [Paraburkholderia aspalathi]|nr:hypothetical protein R75465_08629 [Paraburkholderia aspalathi]